MPINNEEFIDFEKNLIDLVTIFSDNYVHKQKLEKIVKRREQHKLHLKKFLELFEQAKAYNLQQARLREFLNKSALKIQADFKSLVSIENLTKTDLSLNEINRIEIYLLSIHNDYKLVRDEMQTLEEINAKLAKYSSKKEFDKIGDLLERGILDKMPNLITKSQLVKNANVTQDKLLIEVQKFYEIFIQNCHLLRADMDRNLDDIEYRKRLQDLQTILIKRQPNDIQYYFDKLIQNEANMGGYSKEILLESFSKNLVVQTYASNNSKFFIEKFFSSFSSSAFWSSKFWRKHFEYYCFILFNFTKKSFQEILEMLIGSNQKNQVLIVKRSILISCIYNQALEFFEVIDTNESKEKSNSLLMEQNQSRKKLLIDHIDSFLKQLSKSEFLFEMRDNIVNEKNAQSTIEIMKMMPVYGGCIKELDFSLNKLEVRYCFSKQFFQVLNEFSFRNVSEYTYFFRLIFYICAFDNKLAEKKGNNFSLEKFNDLKFYFDEPFVVNSNELNDLVEGLRVLISMGSFEFRLKCALECLKFILERNKDEENQKETDTHLSKEQKANLIKINVFKYFYSNRADGINEKKFILKLAETLNIHLIKYSFNFVVISDLIKVLTSNNRIFGIFIEKTPDFNIENDLVAGFGIPYYLTANEEIETSSESLISILFRVFICDSIMDRKEFMMNKQTYVASFKELINTVKKLEKFYDEVDEKLIQTEYKNKDKLLVLVKSYCKHLREISFKHIIDGFKGDYHESLVNRKKYADKIIKNFINYDLEHIITIIESTNDSNVAESILAKCLSQIMKRGEKSLAEWADSTSSIGSKIDFLHFYYKYSQEEFDEWFKELNPNILKSVLDELSAKRKDTIAEFNKNAESFENSSSIKHLQHNQAGALTLIFNELSKNKNANIFMKIGTGQGKSLIIADTVRKLIQINGPSTQVFVFTCYDHLAERDQKNFSKFYQSLGISSIYCSPRTLIRDTLNKQVIYADLHCFVRSMFRDANECLTSSRSFDMPDFKNSILVLDEFDSLILDSDEIYQYSYAFEVRKLSGDERLPVEKSNIKEYFGVCDAIDKHFKKGFSSWYDWMKESARIEKAAYKENVKHDSLGKKHTFGGSFLNKLEKEGIADLFPTFLDALSFLKEFKQTIGFSGSIKEDGMSRFEALFSTQPVFYKIPPFFGKKRLEMNRKFVDTPARIIENKDRFVQAVLDHIKNRCQTQPILIFAESEKWSDKDEKSDFDMIYEALEKEKMRVDDDRLSNCDILKISNEWEVRDNLSLIGYAKTITIATRIIARGADIQVFKEITNGLHLLITYYPKRRNIYKQMLGRTARMDKPGTYSIITRYGENYEREEKIKVNEHKQALHKLADWFFRENIAFGKNQDNYKLRWPFFLRVLASYNTETRLDKLKDFVQKEIF